MGRVVATFGGVFVLALLAGGLTEATLALGHRGSLSNDSLLRPAATKVKPSPTASPVSTKPTVTPVPTPVATPIPTPIATPAASIATTNAFVHMRAGKSTSTAILIDLNGGAVVRLLSGGDAQWQQVQFNGLTGYIFKTYLTY
jgi:hypothetical protein